MYNKQMHTCTHFNTMSQTIKGERQREEKMKGKAEMRGKCGQRRDHEKKKTREEQRIKDDSRKEN